MSCKGCNFTQYPQCAVQSIVFAPDIEFIFNNKKCEETSFPVCHKNAQSIEGNKIRKNELCDNCMICDMLCPFFAETKTIDYRAENAVFSNLSKLNILLKNILSKDIIVATEVKAQGNARGKRIDLVIKKGKTIFLIKVLTDIDKYAYYSRSYETVMSYYVDKYQDYTISTYALIPSQKQDIARAKGYNCKNIGELIKELQEL